MEDRLWIFSRWCRLVGTPPPLRGARFLGQGGR